MGGKQSRVQSPKITYYVEGESQIPQPGMRFKSEKGKIYHLISLLSETDNSFNFLAVEWIPSILETPTTHNDIQELNSLENSEENQIEKIFVVKFIKLLYNKIHMIQNELNMMKTFAKQGNQNYIVECYDYFVSKQADIYPYVCIVTPYAQGGTLLKYLHYFRNRNQFNHRDLNLKNIFLINELLSQESSVGTINDFDPIIALADFGCATFIDDKENCDEIDVEEEENDTCSECDEGCDHCKDQMKKNSTKFNHPKSSTKSTKNHSRFHKKKYVLNQLVGTPVFIAPEMYEEKPYGVGVDIWSLGVVLYALMSGGEPPFPFSSNLEVMKWIVIHKQIEYPEEFFGGYSNSALSLLKMMLDRDPTKRITAEAALRHPWFTEVQN